MNPRDCKTVKHFWSNLEKVPAKDYRTDKMKVNIQKRRVIFHVHR